jgi:hypothetical protein
MIDWINHHGLEILIAGIIYNSAVQALPKPENCGKFYIFVYGFSHAIAANWGLVSKAKDKLVEPCDVK